jgi:hypothetical protein
MELWPTNVNSVGAIHHRGGSILLRVVLVSPGNYRWNETYAVETAAALHVVDVDVMRGT